MWCPVGHIELSDLRREIFDYARGLETAKGGYSILSKRYYLAEGILFFYRFVFDQKKNFFASSPAGGLLKLSPNIFQNSFPIPDQLPKDEGDLWYFIDGGFDYLHICPHHLVIRPKHNEDLLVLYNDKLTAETLMPLSGSPVFWRLPAHGLLFDAIDNILGEYGSKKGPQPSAGSSESAIDLILRCSREGMSKAEVKRLHFPTDSARKYAMRRKKAAELDPTLEKPGRRTKS